MINNIHSRLPITQTFFISLEGWSYREFQSKYLGILKEISKWVIQEKIHTPTMAGTLFFTSLLPHGFPKLPDPTPPPPNLHSGFPTSNSPAPMRIYIKSLDAKIFIHYKCTGLFVAFRWSFFIIYDTRLWV